MPFGKELLIDVFEAYFYKDNKMVFMSKNMTSTGISNSQSESEVRNGAGNGLYAVLSGQKEVTVSLTENVFSFEMIAMQTGSPIVTGAGVGITSSITGRAESDKTFAIPETPKSGEVLNVYDGENKLPSSAFTVSGKKITFTTAPSNEIFVEPYRFNTDAMSQTITIDADTFAEGGELWLKGVTKDQKEKATNYIWFHFENVKPNGSFDINSASEKQAQDMSVEMKVMKNSNNELYTIHKHPII